MYATRLIKAGEEITVSYIDLHNPRAKRRQYLRASYLFDCGCSYCNLPSADAIAQSDLHRSIVASFDPANQSVLREWFRTPGMPAEGVLSVFIKVHEYFEVEGMHSRYRHRGVVDTIAGVYGTVGDEKNFKMWCRKALDLYAVEGLSQEGREKITMYKKWLADPTSFSPWNKRQGSNVGREN